MDIDDILLYDETLFKNIEAFNPDYIPENFMHRKSQMEALAICMRPALRKGRPVNSLVLGSCATGKTTAIKKIFEMVEKSSDKVVCVYINCQIHTTRFGIFSQIYQKIFGHTPPETGVPFSRIYQKIMQHLSSEDKALVVALDDINYLFYSKNANKIFYDILRAHEAFEGIKTGVFAILSDIEFRFMLDKNVNSIFIPQEIIFNPYSPDEMNTILKERAKIGFYPDVISDELIMEIAEYAASSGDLRVGIDLLRISGNLAESDASKTIEKKHIEESLKNTGSINLTYILKSLSEDEKMLLNLIRGYDGDLTAGNLYDTFNKMDNVSYASFNRILNKLEFLRLIDTKFTGKGVKGNSRVIILRFEPEEIKKCMNPI
ncbi:MAG: ORC1-type DNA replication protein [Methanobacterium sp.]|uniref:ORC1-type DNA replication protein n=1 Tax=Methanobacterium sp. TaxID=2164 RepID=UPI003D65F7F8|nr:ORC1-type DNA replication protein [Methanobacterium sp.]